MCPLSSLGEVYGRSPKLSRRVFGASSERRFAVELPRALPQIRLFPAGALAGGRPLHGHGGHPEFPVGGPAAGQARAAAAQIAKLGPDAARVLLRHQVSEQNRWYFETWGLIGAGDRRGAAADPAFRQHRKEFLPAGCAADAADRHRATIRVDAADGVPGAHHRLDSHRPAVAERSRFWMLHNAFVGLELLNWALGVFLTGKLLFRRRRRPGEQDAEL
jgi:hypothetical protein